MGAKWDIQNGVWVYGRSGGGARSSPIYTAPITPLDFPNTTGWFRADVTTNDGTQVSIWDNQLGAGNDLTATQEPYLATIAGQDSIRFGNSGMPYGGCNSGGGGTLGDYIDVDGYHMFVVYFTNLATLDNANAYLNHTIVGDTAGYFGVSVRNTAGVYTIGGYHLSGTYRNVYSAAVSIGQVQLVEYWYDATKMNLRVDNAAPVTFVTGNTGTAATLWASNVLGDVRFDGYISEILIADSDNSGWAGLADLRQYFGDRYGMAV